MNDLFSYLFFAGFLFIFYFWIKQKLQKKKLQNSFKALPDLSTVKPSETVQLAKTNLGFYLWTDKRDGYLGKYLANGQAWKPHLAISFQKFVKPADEVIEIGSNYGYYTLFLSKLLGKKGKLYSYEAHPLLQDILQQNLRMNDSLQNIVSNSLAVYDSETKVPYFSGFSNLGGSFVIGRNQNTEDLKQFEYYQSWTETTVPTTTLDLEQKRHSFKEVSLLYMEAQGCELPILEGAFEFLERSRSIKIVMPWNPRLLMKYGSLRPLLDKLEAMSFKFYCINKNNDFIQKTKDQMISLTPSDIIISRWYL